MKFFFIFSWFIGFLFFSLTSSDDVNYATPCEVCKIVSHELENRLKETGKTHDVIETGYNIEAKKHKKKYQSS